MEKAFSPEVLTHLYRPASNSHKGQNGRLLVIGGSQLFHASIFWAADVASRIVDLVHFSSPAMENNDLVRMKIKSGFWNGIVVPFEEIEHYIEEDDCILIGPGMPRADGLQAKEQPTKEIVNRLLKSHPDKKWVVDGGALQEVDPACLNGRMLLTPHHMEWERLSQKVPEAERELTQFSKAHGELTILLKGEKDIVCKGEKQILVSGGNAGLTKGGTGDVLAGLTAALYCKNDSFLSAQAASFVNKKAGEALARDVGDFYSAGDLVTAVPAVLNHWVSTS